MDVPVDKSDVPPTEIRNSVDLSLAHPRVFRDPADVDRARRNARETDWGAALLDDVIELAESVPLGTAAADGTERKRSETAFPLPAPDQRVAEPHHPREDQGVWPFMTLQESELRELALVPDAAGEYYFSFPYHGEYQTLQNGTASPIDGSPLHFTGFDEPGTVMDESGHVFPGEHDGIEIRDDGDGWVVPPDVPADWAAADQVGDRFWFRAVYNGRMARLIRSSVSAIAYAYLLTEEETYARRAALMLDLIAEPFANTAGMVDYHNEVSDSRLYRRGYSVDTLLIRLLDAADVVWPSGTLDAPSVTVPDRSIAENIGHNLAGNGAAWMWARLHDSGYARIYHNGTDRYNRTLMVCASFAGLAPGLVDWCLDGQVSLSNFLTNTVFRDGQYYEMSSQYAQSFRKTAEAAYQLSGHPRYPDGWNAFDDSRYELLNVHGPRARNVAGRSVKFGDGPPDLAVNPEPEAGDFELVLRFYGYTSDSDKRDTYAQLLAEIAGGDPNERLAEIAPQYWDVEGSLWPLFHIDEEITGYDLGDVDVEVRDSELLPGRGFAHFRPEERVDQGAALRYGPPLSKAHCDQLGLHLYGAGRELSYDPGHSPTNQQRAGFLRQTIAHNAVVVNERSQIPPEAAGGVLKAFGTDHGYALADVDDPMAYGHEAVDTYRRTTAFRDTPLGQSYVIDVFRVDGGEQRDFAVHGLGADLETDLALGNPDDGSLASPDYRWDRMEEGGWIPNTADENPEPGNGYGFLTRPRTAPGDEQWQATWQVRPEQGDVGDSSPGQLRVTMLGAADRSIVVADGPEVLSHNLGLAHPRDDVAPEDRIPFVLAREEGSRPSTFVSIMEPVGESFPVTEVTDLEPAGGDDPFAAVAMAIQLADEETMDYVLSTLGEAPITASDDRGEFHTNADFATLRRDESGVTAVHVEGGTHFRYDPTDGDPLVLEPAPDSELGDAGRYTGRIARIDDDPLSIHIDAPLPDDSFTGQHALIDAPEYARNSQYEIADIASTETGATIELTDTDLTLSRGTVDAIEDDNVLVSPTDFPLTWTRAHYAEGRGNEYFDGRLTVVNEETGVRTTIIDADGDRRLTVADASGFSVGDTFRVVDIKVGDRVEIPLSAHLRRTETGWTVDGPGDVAVRHPEID